MMKRDSTAVPATDSTRRPALPGSPRPAGYPGPRPATAQPADSTGRKVAPNLIQSPANTPSPGTSTPNGTVPAGSPGGRP